MEVANIDTPSSPVPENLPPLPSSGLPLSVFQHQLFNILGISSAGKAYAISWTLHSA